MVIECLIAGTMAALVVGARWQLSRRRDAQWNRELAALFGDGGRDPAQRGVTTHPRRVMVIHGEALLLGNPEKSAAGADDRKKIRDSDMMLMLFAAGSPWPPPCVS